METSSFNQSCQFRFVSKHNFSNIYNANLKEYLLTSSILFYRVWWVSKNKAIKHYIKTSNKHHRIPTHSLFENLLIIMTNLPRVALPWWFSWGAVCRSRPHPASRRRWESSASRPCAAASDVPWLPWWETYRRIGCTKLSKCH